MGMLMSWFQDFQQQIYRNFLTDDALQLILGGFQNTLVIFLFGAIWAFVLASLITYLHFRREGKQCIHLTGGSDTAK